MCGIVGVCHLDRDPRPPFAGIEEALARMERRGPDGEGIFDGPGVVLGHRRLAVVDVEGGPQPWIDPDVDVVVVYNGEIFNHQRLRAELAARGHRFRSTCDTEVLTKAYLEWGDGCLDRFEGMFAFALLDTRSNRLLVARDRLGVKPLYFSVDRHRLAFASSVAALRALPGVSGRIDLDAVSHYLTTVRTTLGRRTLLRDVQTLLPGEKLWADLDRGTVAISTWWDLPATAPDDKDPATLDAAAAELRAHLDAAVADRLLADVPLGGFLSGGIDSSAIAALATARATEPFTTYSVGYDVEGFGEWPWIREVAGHLGLANREVHLAEDDYTGPWLALVAEKGLPLSTPNEVGIYHLASALRQECTVALTGEGADEVLGGYTIPHFSALDFDRAQGDLDGQLSRALQRMYGRDRFDSLVQHWFLVNSWAPAAAQQTLLTPDAWRNGTGTAAVVDHYRDLLGRFEHCSTMDAYLHVHARINLEGLLSRVDSSTMAASVEARVPFTDHRLVEFAFGLPDHLKIHWRDPVARDLGAGRNATEIAGDDLVETKRTLRRAFRTDLPASVIDRKKMSFPTPFIAAFEGPLAPTVDAILDASPLVGTVLSPAAIRTMSARFDPAFWPVVNLCLWSLNEHQPLEL